LPWVARKGVVPELLKAADLSMENDRT